MIFRLASTAYALPDGVELAEMVLVREQARVNAALAPLSPALRKRVTAGLGLKRLRVCGEMQPYDLAREAAVTALADAGLRPAETDLIIDFSTLPGSNGRWSSLAQKLSADLGAETSLNLSFRVGGCGGLHLAFKNAMALMASDENLRTALLITGDSPPAGSRSLMPITVQGDAGSAVVLRRDAGDGPMLLGTELMTLGHLHDAITVSRDEIQVNSARIENEVMPVYYLNFYRLVDKLLGRLGLRAQDIGHVIYSNISRMDQEGFARMLQVPPAAVYTPQLAEYGHTFASDLVINYTDLRRADRIAPGQLMLWASAGIGFTWGISVVRA
jgi:3-oxoacyl-[acyl-carrier-protein] synthase-3